MGVPLYTTPTFTLTFTEKDLDLTQAENVYVTFRSGAVFLTKTGENLTVDEKTISVDLTQEETASFVMGVVEIQANWTQGNKRIASEVATYDMTKQLLTAVVT